MRKTIFCLVLLLSVLGTVTFLALCSDTNSNEPLFGNNQTQSVPTGTTVSDEPVDSSSEPDDTGDIVPEDCVHEWTNATCVAPKTCSKCGETEGEALGHSWNAATCTTPKTCGTCGAAEGEALGHSWNAATCTTPKTCGTCGVTEGEALGHSWNAATCTTPKTCGTCGAAEGEALGHSWNAATCTTPKTCGTCGVTEGEALGHAWNAATCTTPKTCGTCGAAEGEALGHSWNAATCTTPKTCGTCGATEGEALGHDYKSVVTSPTCTEKGYTTHTCNRCGESYVDTYVNATGHTAGAEATCTTPQKCTVCGTELVAALGHDYNAVVTDPTCTAKGYTTHTCANCGDSYIDSYVDMIGHNYEAVVTAPTCTAQGYTTYTCSRCDASYVDNYVAANGHSWTNACDTTCNVCGATRTIEHDYKADVTAPTCTAEGYTTYTCSVCGDSYVANKVAATGHSYNAVVTAPTCTAQGYTTYTCSVCGDSYTANEVAALGHNWTAANCTTPKTCGTCGETEGEALGHSWVNATCTAPKTCSVCGETQGEELGHNYEAVVTDPTCTAQGFTTHTCSRCDASYVDTYVAAKGHAWTNACDTTCNVCGATRTIEHAYEAAVTAPTCTAEGYTTYTCSVCGDSYVANKVAATGHSYNAVVTAPTCTAQGYTTYTCSVCGDFYTANEVAALGHIFTNDCDTSCNRQGCEFTREITHTYESVVTNPTCTEKGYTTYTCSVCGNSYKDNETAAKGHAWTNACDTECNNGCGTTRTIEHDYDAVVTAPTCTAEGYTTYTCSVCGDSYVANKVAALGHTWTNACDTTCNVCGATRTIEHDYEADVTAPTCTAEGYTTYTCSVCGDSYVANKVAATGHSYNAVVTAPTCTAAGYTTYTCSVCGDSYTANEVAALGHNYKVVVTAPTCTEKGYTTHTCDRCGESYVDTYVNATGHTAGAEATCTTPQKCTVCGTELEAALGHNYKAVVTAPTCTEKGYTTHTCDRCGESYVDTYVNATGHTAGAESTCTTPQKCTVCGTDLAAALGHDYKAVVTAPTCTEKGYTTHTCDRCGESYVDTYINANGHTAGAEATCTTAQNCTVCNAELVAVLGHDYKAVVTNPTCTDEGYTTYTCDRCGESYIDDYVNATGHNYVWVVDTQPTFDTEGAKHEECTVCHDKRNENTIIDKLTCSHNLEKTEAVPATCLSAGNKEYYTCSICGKVYSNEEGTLETTVADCVIAALGHDYKAVVTDPTCTANGYTTHTCDRCDDSYVDTYVDALGHSYNAVVTAPTCTAEGYTTYTCSVCGDSYVADKVAATGHSWTNACDTTCNACGATRTIEHDYEAEVTAPTCTAEGYTTYTCSVCGNSYVANKVAATGHSYNAVVTAPTCTAQGYTTYTCSVCGDTYTANEVAALGHIFTNDCDTSCNRQGCEFTREITHAYEPVVTAPTCTAAGYTTYTCSVCGHSYIANEVAALGHDYKAVVTAPTCTEKGYTTHTCSRCDASYVDTYIAANGHTEVIDAAVAATCTATGLTQGKHCSVCSEVLVAQETVAALGHDYNAVVTDPTCTAKGYTTHTCANCGDSYVDSYVDMIGHNYEAVVTDPTCTAQGFTTHTCSRCDASYVDTYVAATGHTWTNACDTECNNGCGTTRTIEHDYEADVTAPTCTAEGYTTYTCSVCGDSYVANKVAATGHSYNAVVTAPTCTAVGYTTYTCSVCGDSYTANEVAALGHNWTAANCTTPKTCGTCGETEGEALGHSWVNATCTAPKTCSVCGETQGEELGHNYEAVVTAPTCTEKGYTTHTCSRCDASYVDTYVAANGHTWTNACDTTCNICGATRTIEHDYDAVVTAPTCTAEGYTTYTCSVCGDSYVANKVAATGHSYNAVVTAPTCTAQGYTTYTCSVCGDSYTANEVAALGHVFTNDCDTSCNRQGCEFTREITHAYESVVTNPTCTEKGYTTYTCSVCGNSYKDNETAAKGHAWTNACDTECNNGCGTTRTIEHDYDAVVTAPTCTAEGYTTYTCSVCGDSYVANKVAANGHSWTNACDITCNVCGATRTIEHDYEADVTAPTCTAEGYTTYTCSVCGDSYVANKVAATGHSYNAVVTAPTCTAQGYTTYTCSVCGDSYTANEVAALGHNWTAANCTTPKTCGTCGETEGEALGHSWVNATCTAPKTCSVCGETQGEELGHNYEAVVTDPTCTAQGYTTHTCSRCDASYVDTYVSANGHTWTNACDTTCNVCGATRTIEHDYEAAVTAPTCTAEGYTTYTCSVCGDSYVANKVAATGHSYNAVVTAPTCTAQGYTTYTCSVCGDSYTANEVAALGHIFTNDCDTSCNRQGCEFTREITHAYESVVTNPTCTEKGYTTYTCSVCGNSYKDNETAAKGHAWTNACDTECNNGCGTTRTIEHDYEAVVTAPTCIAEGYTTYTCSVCGDSYVADKVAANGHTWTNACDTTCNVCGATRTIEHDYEAVVTAPTCTAEGYTTYTCSVCGDSYVANKVAALGHTWTNACDTTCNVCGATRTIEHAYEADVTAPTCTAEGYTTYTCSVCGDSYVANKVAATGHSYNAVVTAPTCTAVGYTTYTCSVCGHSYTANEVAALGHNWTAANCTTPKTCGTCGETEGEALGHSWVNATCTAPKTCSVCGETQGEELGHNYEAVVTDPTCTEKGYTTHTCSRCDDSYVDTYVDETGHTEAIDAAVAPTCTETGLTEGKHCSVCGDILVAHDVVDALGHDYDAVVTDPTCTAKGYTTHTCSRCDDSYVDSYTEIINHEYEGVVTDPTCTAKGYTTYTCVDCGDSYVSDYTDMIDHEYESVVTAPTCTAQGYTTHTCVNCGNTYADATVEALGHDYAEEWTIDVAPTCAKVGSKSHHCTRCSAKTDITEVAKTEDHKINEDTNFGICDICGRSFIITVAEANKIGMSYEKGAYSDGYYYVMLNLDNQVNADGFARTTFKNTTGNQVYVTVDGGYLTGDDAGSILLGDTVIYKAKLGAVNSSMTTGGKEARLYDVAKWKVIAHAGEKVTVSVGDNFDLITYDPKYAEFVQIYGAPAGAPAGVTFTDGFYYAKRPGNYTIDNSALIWNTYGNYGYVTFDLYVQSVTNLDGTAATELELQLHDGAQFVSVTDSNGNPVTIYYKDMPHVILKTGQYYHIVIDMTETIRPEFYIAWANKKCEFYMYNLTLEEPRFTYVIDNAEQSIVCKKDGETYGYFAWPTVTSLGGDRLIAVASGFRTAHIDTESKIAVWYSYNGGLTWSEPEILVDTLLDDRDAGVVYWNGKIVVSWFCASKAYYLNYNSSKYSAWAATIDDAYDTNYMGGNYIVGEIDENGNITWSDVYFMPDGMFTSHGLIVNPDGGLTSVGYLKYDKENKRWGTGIAVRTTDGTMNENGFVWSAPIIIADSNTQYAMDFQEPYGVYNDDGVLIVVMRSDNGLYQCELKPGATKFTDWHKIANVQETPAHIIKHSSGVLIMTYGYRGLYIDPLTGESVSAANRYKDDTLGIRARISYDGGMTWTREIILTYGLAPTTENTSDWGYSSSVELSDGRILTMFYQRTGDETMASIYQVIWELPEDPTGEKELILVGGKPESDTYANDGVKFTTVSGQTGEDINILTPPKRLDYNFAGWYLDYACTIPFVATTYSKDLVLYADWVSNKEDQITVMSYNVGNSGWTNSDGPTRLAFKDANNPDIICLQYAASAWKTQSFSGYTASYQNQKENANNFLIYYKTDKFDVVTSNYNDYLSYIVLKRKSDGAQFLVVNTYFNNNTDAATQQKQLNAIWERIDGTWKDKNRGLMPIIITGSLSASPDSSNIYQSVTENGLFVEASAPEVAKSTPSTNSANTGDYVFVSYHMQYAVESYNVLTKRNNSYPIVVKVALPKVCPHVVAKVEASAPTCETAGNVEYYACTKCDKVYLDVYGTRETTVEDCTIAPLGHNWTNACDTECNNDCGKTREITHKYKWVVDVQPTFDATGIKHEECTVCQHTRNENTIIDMLTCAHELTKFEATAPTCEAAGNEEYYVCSLCEQVYTNAEGTLETTVEDCTIAALGHNWVEASCVAPKTCYACGSTEGTVSDKHVIDDKGFCEICRQDFNRTVAFKGGQLDYGTYTNANKQIATSVSGVVGEDIPLPTPTLEGHTLDGWYLDYACTKRLTENTFGDYATLYAKWKPNTEDITVMSFNIKTEISKGSRDERVIALIQAENPDVVCFQEADDAVMGLFGWMSILNDRLPDLGYTAVYANKWGRDGENSGEHTAIFYKTDKFTPIASGTRWLSTTPNEVSKYSYTANGTTYSANYNRIVTYVLLERKSDGGSFLVANTHLDNNGDNTNAIAEKIRQAEVDILMQIINGVTSSRGDIPVIVTGDFNVTPDLSKSAYKAMTQTYGYSDSSKVAKAGDKGAMTYTNMDDDASKWTILDYIFVSRHMKDAVLNYTVCDSKDSKGEWISDHNAIISKIAVPFVKRTF